MYKTVEEIVEREVKRSSKMEHEYWGPMTLDFSDAFLSMAHSMLYSNFSKDEIKLLKAIYSITTELVQNIAEYNEKNKGIADNSIFINQSFHDTHAQITCSNPILSKDVNPLRDRFVKMDKLTKDELTKEYTKALLNGGSLGLLMIYRLSGIQIKWHIHKGKDQLNWLSMYVKLSYASFRN